MNYLGMFNIGMRFFYLIADFNHVNFCVFRELHISHPKMPFHGAVKNRMPMTNKRGSWRVFFSFSKFKHKKKLIGPYLDFLYL